jgi:hypothetical protein
MKKRLLVLILLASLLITLLPALPASAADPVVTITVSARIVAITNTQATWAIGDVIVDQVVYFSATGAQDDDYSQIENTGNCAVDVEIQGTDFEGGSYDWTLASSAGDQIYSFYANSEAAPTVYDVEIKSSSYGDLITNLVATDTYDWSMKFTAPSAFNGSDAGSQKTATVTLVASKH